MVMRQLSANNDIIVGPISGRSQQLTGCCHLSSDYEYDEVMVKLNQVAIIILLSSLDDEKETIDQSDWWKSEDNR